jgi:hypothetical protein
MRTHGFCTKDFFKKICGQCNKESKMNSILCVFLLFVKCFLSQYYSSVRHQPFVEDHTEGSGGGNMLGV